jgi:alpha-L-rhamnosidase
MPRLRVAGPAGSTVRLTPAEVTNADGTIFRGTMGRAARGSSWWQYTKATDGEETWFPRFYYVGSRYLQVETFPPGEVPTRFEDFAEARASGRVVPPEQLPHLVSLEAVIVHANTAPTGQFATANPRLNQIRDLVRWAQRSNMVSILTDCPHREKLGWIEQFHLNGPAIRYEFDVARIFTKAMLDMADAQTDEGLIPNIAPEYTQFKGAFRGAAEWGAAFIVVPWQQYLFDGDVELLRTHYAAMKRYVAYLESRTVDGILSDGLGDWYDLDLATPGRAGLTPAPVTATAMYYVDTDTLARIAAVLGQQDDAVVFTKKAAAIRARYLEKFYVPATGTYGTGSQASLAIPLVAGIVEPAHRAAVLAALTRDVEQRGYATAGDIGFRSLLQALAANGRSDVIYRLINQDEKPGYAYQIKQGATSLTEAWDANRGVSQNHFMLGQITEWFYQDLAGITVDPAAPGFKHILVRPQPVADLAWVDASYDSVRGRISTRWERRGDRFLLTVSIPANTSATISIPSRDGTAVTEGGSTADTRPAVRFVARKGDRAVYRVESGTFAFESRW